MTGGGLCRSAPACTRRAPSGQRAGWDGRLCSTGTTWRFNRPEAARALADALGALLSPRDRPASRSSPGDFAAAGLTEEGLNDLLAELALD